MSGIDTYKKQGDNEKKRNVQIIVFDLRQLLERNQSFMKPLPPTSKSDEPVPTTPSTPTYSNDQIFLKAFQHSRYIENPVKPLRWGIFCEIN